jgi:hypothetical protein
VSLILGRNFGWECCILSWFTHDNQTVIILIHVSCFREKKQARNHTLWQHRFFYEEKKIIVNVMYFRTFYVKVPVPKVYSLWCTACLPLTLLHLYVDCTVSDPLVYRISGYHRGKLWWDKDEWDHKSKFAFQKTIVFRACPMWVNGGEWSICMVRKKARYKWTSRKSSTKIGRQGIHISSNRLVLNKTYFRPGDSHF